MLRPSHYSLAIVIFLFTVSCSQYPSAVQEVLNKAGNNRAELEKVIAHCKKDENPEKLKAAYFLIGNMGDKYSLEGETVRNYDVLFDILDSLHRKKIKIPVTSSPVLRATWDSLVARFGFPSRREADRLPDYHCIKGELLIENIDEAFSMRSKTPWLKELSFEQFCEYILPYRTGTERLESWRRHLRQQYQQFVDTAVFKNQFELAALFNKYMRKNYSLNHIVREYPFDMTVSQMEKGKRGACIHLVQYEAMALRAMGVPVGIDYTLLWGDLNRGHEWNTLLLENDSIFPFDAAQEKFGGILGSPYRYAKVYRYSFATQKNESPLNRKDIPSMLVNEHRIDVTHEYTKTFDITVPLDFSSKRKKPYAIICTFRSKGWAPQHWGLIKDNKAYFKNMGCNILYIAMHFDRGRYYPLSNPFVLEKNGTVRMIKTDTSSSQTVTLLRKYPDFPRNRDLMASMIGMRFQGANKRDFSDSTELFTITSAPTNYEEVNITHPQKFRYVRCVAGREQKMNIAELQFFGATTIQGERKKINGKIIGFPRVSPELGTSHEQAFDNNLETYFLGPDASAGWVGLEFSQPNIITTIGYCPRSDTNFILKGDTYELCYWNNDRWVSIEKQVASDKVLTYHNVPMNGLYILHNLTRGKEERIFTYEDGKQNWW